MWGFLAQLSIKLLVLLFHEVEGWNVHKFSVVKKLFNWTAIEDICQFITYVMIVAFWSMNESLKGTSLD